MAAQMNLKTVLGRKMNLKEIYYIIPLITLENSCTAKNTLYLSMIDIPQNIELIKLNGYLCGKEKGRRVGKGFEEEK